MSMSMSFAAVYVSDIIVFTYDFWDSIIYSG